MSEMLIANPFGITVLDLMKNLAERQAQNRTGDVDCQCESRAHAAVPPFEGVAWDRDLGVSFELTVIGTALWVIQNTGR